VDKLPFKIGDVPIQRNFDALVKAVVSNASTIASNVARLGVLEALGLTKRTRGVVNIASVASVTSNTATVTHGLGSTPSVVLANAQNSSGGLVAVGPFNIGATTFDLQFRYTDGVARSLTIVVGWEAIA
jgi:hypothetical protein